jgi:hypothetical protein
VSAGRHDELTPEERDLLARAAGGSPAPPDPRWGDYRAQLRARLDARRSPGARLRWWWARPAPIALSFGLATALLLFALQPAERRPDVPGGDDAMVASRLDLLEHYRVVERLDLLEDLDVIRQLELVSLRGR